MILRRRGEVDNTGEKLTFGLASASYLPKSEGGLTTGIRRHVMLAQTGCPAVVASTSASFTRARCRLDPHTGGIRPIGPQTTFTSVFALATHSAQMSRRSEAACGGQACWAPELASKVLDATAQRVASEA